jgi:hypothetical protein
MSMKSLPNIALPFLCLNLIFSGQLLAEPAGIFSLGNALDNPNTKIDERLANIRSYDFVSGFTLRVFWKDLETSQGVYDFSVIDEAVKRVEAVGQHLNLEVLQGVPQYVIDGAGSTYLNSRNEVTPVPWDSFAQSRFAALQNAMANHVVDDGTGANLPLNQQSVLVSVGATPVGLNLGVRDLNNAIRNLPDYTQQRFINSIVQGVGVSRSAFSNQQGSLTFFAFSDGQAGVPVDQQLITRLDGLYNGNGQSSLAFFIENLSDLGPVPLGVGSTGNNLLTWSGLGGDTMMQGLDSWLKHTPSRDSQLSSLNPATGIELAYDTYGTRFFELYVTDLDGAMNGALDATGQPILNDLTSWNATLVAVPEPSAIMSILLMGVMALLPLRRQQRDH